MRRVTKRYLDPLEQVWLGCARELGLTITRSSEVFASYDGEGILTLGTEATLDADDCVAQMVLHELCHWLVQGEGAEEQPDWGLDNMSERDLEREHACVVLQATLLVPHGLEHVLAPTTEHRAFYDAHLLEADRDEASLSPRVAELTRGALLRARAPRWKPLDRALAASAQITRAVAPYAEADSLLR